METMTCVKHFPFPEARNSFKKAHLGAIPLLCPVFLRIELGFHSFSGFTLLSLVFQFFYLCCSPILWNTHNQFGSYFN